MVRAELLRGGLSMHRNLSYACMVALPTSIFAGTIELDAVELLGVADAEVEDHNIVLALVPWTAPELSPLPLLQSRAPELLLGLCHPPLA